MKENVCWAIAGCLFLLTGLSAGDLLFAGQERGVRPMPSVKEKEPEKRKARPSTVPVDHSGLRILLHPGFDPKKPQLYRTTAPAELLLIDPQGRRIGYDPIKGVTYHEVAPESFYEEIGLDDDVTGDPGPTTKELYIHQPLAGDYQLQVMGTDAGIYTLEIAAYDPELSPSGENFENISITPSEIHTYRFHFAKTVKSKIKIQGPFKTRAKNPKIHSREQRGFLLCRVEPLHRAAR